MSTEEFDYVVIGAGSAGCALSYRLAEDGRYTTLVLEYGGTDAGPLIQMPSALSYPMNMSTYDWGFASAPEPGLDGRELACPRGKVIGGSSSINGMVYVRGHAGDYEEWVARGAQGWGYADVLPYFKRMESSHGGQDGWRGSDGPLHVTRGPRKNPLYEAFVKAGEQAGYHVTADYNGEQQEGFGPMEMTVWGGRRWSAANAYLRPAMRRGRVSLRTRSLVTRVLFDGHKATGVEYRKSGQRHTVNARRGVVLSASAINSPALLLRSGVGPAAHLAEHGIDVVADRPGVGSNLQDHLELYIQQECLQPITLNGRLGLLSKAAIGLEWLLARKGLGATNHFESAAFIRSRAGVRYPDIQYHFLPAAIRYDGKQAATAHGFQAHVGPMRSDSRGEVRLTSADPQAPPRIQFNYLTAPRDMEEFRTCIRLTREIFSQPAFEGLAGRELQPGDAVQSDDELDGFIREHVESAYHPCGTCAMGAASDPMAVVDPTCKVIGVEGLHVIDSSIFPRITNGNLNGPSIMVGEKGADHLLGKPALPASNQQPWFHPQWQTDQR